MTNDDINLTIIVDTPGRQYLTTSGQNICIIRQFTDNNQFVVASAVFNPFGQTNTVVFHSAWRLYVMAGSIDKASRVNMQITQDVNQGNQYTFTGNTFTNPAKAYSTGVFGLDSQSNTSAVCAGLSQKMNVNNTDSWFPLNAAALPYNEITYFVPSDDIIIFIANGINQGDILPASILSSSGNDNARTPSNMGRYLQVTLTADTTIHFNDTNNSFEAGSA